MSTTPVTTRAFELAAWQSAALEAWSAGGALGPHRGTLEIFTGGGKTLIGLEAFARATADDPTFRLAVIVPTRALANQWLDAVRRWTTVDPDAVGVLGGGPRATFDKQVLIAVINSAAKYLPDIAGQLTEPLLLIVDECHRAGAPTFSKALDAKAARILGLSATPDREEVDEDGLPVDYDAHLLGLKIGPVVYRFGLREARAAGWLPEFSIHHHAVDLDPGERHRYEGLSRRIDTLADALAEHGIEVWRARFVARGHGADAQDAKAYVGAVAQRKDLLYRANERGRIARRIVADAMDAGSPRVLLFHERVDEATSLAEDLMNEHGADAIALEHSGLSSRQREAAIQAFRAGRARVLVSVRSLIEGIDVPEADVGISVASTSSVRQRVQALGRVLRRGEASKQAKMHVLYADGTVDEALYRKADWGDLTGPDRNRYWHWRLGGDSKEERFGPPQTPLALEEDEWERHGRLVTDPPTAWKGVIPDAEYSIDTHGNVTSPAGRLVDNPQGVGAMLMGAGRSGGHFRITPEYLLVLVSMRGADGLAFHVAGQLTKPFEVRATPPRLELEVVEGLAPGDPYHGAADKSGGSYKLASGGGGRLLRRTATGWDVAITSSHDHPDLAQNARAVLTAWRRLGGAGRTFDVDRADVAWVADDGQIRFLASVPGGFLFAGEILGNS